MVTDERYLSIVLHFLCPNKQIKSLFTESKMQGNVLFVILNIRLSWLHNTLLCHKP
jgi:hypothetical protein